MPKMPKMYRLDTESRREDAEIQAEWEGFYEGLDDNGSWTFPLWIVYHGADSRYAVAFRKGYAEGAARRLRKSRSEYFRHDLNGPQSIDGPNSI